MGFSQLFAALGSNMALRPAILRPTLEWFEALCFSAISLFYEEMGQTSINLTSIVSQTNFASHRK